MRLPKPRLPFVVLLCTLATSTDVYSEPQLAATSSESLTTYPATFGRSEDAIYYKAPCPSKLRAEQTAYLYCTARVNTDGSVSRYASRCSSMERKYARWGVFVTKALKRSRFAPAAVDNVPTEVDFRFQLIASHAEGGCDITVLPNLGMQAEKYGIGYVAPQPIVAETYGTKVGKLMRRLEESLFLEKTSSSTIGREQIHARSPAAYQRRAPYAPLLAIISVDVSESGTSSQPRVIDTAVLGDWTNRLVDAAAEAKFIPGFYMSKPEPMSWYSLVMR